jgi:hypothetical protein
MGIDDRDYMHDRYRDGEGARRAPVSRDGPGRLEYEERGAIEAQYPRRHGLSGMISRSGARPSKNLLAAGVLGVAALIYILWAQPFGEILDFSGLPKNGEFRVLQEHTSKPTGILAFTAADKPVALHLLGDNDKPVFVGFIRANETAELMVPVGRWHTIATEGTETSLIELPEMRSGTPLGMIEIKAGEFIAAKPIPSENEQ